MLTPYHTMRFVMTICRIKYMLSRYCLTSIVCQGNSDKEKGGLNRSTTVYK
jgi:hypothetical protein